MQENVQKKWKNLFSVPLTLQKRQKNALFLF